MSKARDNSLSIVPAAGESPLSKGQTAFNALIRQIQKRRARLAEWEAVTTPYQQKYASEFLPGIDACTALRVEIVHRLDHLSYDAALSRLESQLISELIVKIAEDVLARREDAALKKLHARHGGAELVNDAGAEAIEAALDDYFSRLDATQGATGDSAPDSPALESEADASSSRRKKSGGAKAKARDARQQQAAREMSQSIREIYRKLVSAIHPDRETDPAERIRKTALMQRVNQAYAKNDLLRMLELQLELEHIAPGALGRIGDDRLEHYNRILKQQVAGLDREIRQVEDEFRAQFGIFPDTPVSPGTILRGLMTNLRDLELATTALKQDLRELGDITRAKSWLKRMRQGRRSRAPTGAEW